MKERPILFNATMVRALLDGSKTQTRRLVKRWDPLVSLSNKPVPDDVSYLPDFTCYRSTCPYGQPGDRLWVRETHSFVPDADEPAGCSQVLYAADGNQYGKLRPSIHMPRWACRIRLEITGVRVERLQDISDQDAIAEGIGLTEHAAGVPMTTPAGETMPRAMYRDWWESIEGPGSWDANPFVWVLDFKRVQEGGAA